MTIGVILPPDWLIMKKVAIPAEIAIIATFMKFGPDSSSNILAIIVSIPFLLLSPR